MSEESQENREESAAGKGARAAKAAAMAAKGASAVGAGIAKLVALLKPALIVLGIILLIQIVILALFISFEFWSEDRATADSACVLNGSTGNSGAAPDQVTDPGLSKGAFNGLAITLRTEPIASDIKMTPEKYLRADGTRSWSSEQLMHAAIIINVAEQMGMQGSGAVIALATAMQEHGLNNSDEAVDHDSVGLFQQRPSTGWGKVEYIMKPHYAAAAFFNGAKYAGQATGVAGSDEKNSYSHNGSNVPWGTTGLLSITGWQDMKLTEAAQAVQRSAHPKLYQQWRGHAEDMYKGIAEEDVGVGPGCNGIPGLGEPGECPFSYEGKLQPTTEKMCGYIQAQFYEKHPELGSISNCLRAGVPGPGNNHPAGRACDLATGQGGNAATGANREFGKKMAEFLVGHAEKLGVCMVIWYKEIWTGQRADEGWRYYNGQDGTPNNDHTNHVHVSVLPEGWQDRPPGSGSGKQNDGLCGWNYNQD